MALRTYLARPLRLALLVAVAALTIGASSAQASLLPGLLPGVLSPSDAPATCDTNATQPFLPWGDSANYVLAPGGHFEAGTAGWTLKNGARVVSGNESFNVHGSDERYSLYLPYGSSASTPAMCFDFADWKVRFFARATGSSSAKLKVTIQVKSLLGILSVLDGGYVAATGDWQPSPELGLLLTNIQGLLVTDAVSFKFTPVGAYANWQIDDVYLDPTFVS